MPGEFGAATFLDSYFAAHAQAMQVNKQRQEADEFQKKLAWEQSQHQQDFQQKQAEFNQRQQYQDMLMKNQQFNQANMESDRKDAAAEKQRNDFFNAVKGGLNIGPAATQPSSIPAATPTPQPNIFAQLTGAGQSPAVAQNNPAAQGPAAPAQQIDLGASPVPPPAPPLALPSVPIPAPQGTVPVPPQMVPGGLPAGQQAYQNTPEEIKRQEDLAKQASLNAGKRQVTPELSEATGGILPVHTADHPSYVDDSTINEILKARAKAADPIKITNELENATQAFVDTNGRQPNGAERLKIAHDVHNNSQSDLTMAIKALTEKKDQQSLDVNAKVADTFGNALLHNANAPVPKDKQSLEAITDWLQKKGYNGMPKSLSPGEDTALSAAVTSMKTMDQIAGQLKNADGSQSIVAANMGPIMGPIQDLGQRLGKDFTSKNPGAIEKMQAFRTLVMGNLVTELKVVNPRAAASLLDFIKQMAPNERMEPAMFAGALDGMRQISYNRVKQSLDKQWGGKAPPEALENYGAPPRKPLEKENPEWRKAGTKDYIAGDDTKVVNSGGKRVLIFHDGTDDKFYPLMIAPAENK